MVYMLDTDISSYIIRGGYGPVERRLTEVPPGDICVSVVTRAELMFGLKSITPGHHLHINVPDFLSTVHLKSWDASAADVHAELRYQMRKAGTPIGTMDTFIAAHAISLGATLVTNNMRHFQRIPLPILLENWRE